MTTRRPPLVSLEQLGPNSPLREVGNARSRSAKSRTDREHPEQVMFFDWCALRTGTYPSLKTIFAVPNFAGMYGTQEQRMRYGARLKREGRKKDVPDIVWPHARGPFHGLFIELKADEQLRPGQSEWLAWLEAEGFHATMARRFGEARDLVEAYIALGPFSQTPGGR